jgi:DNA-binding NarL/FixJ family response regulator
MALPKILLVSADAGFVKKAESLLVKDFALAAVDSGKGAMKALSSNKGIRVILSGYNLPDVDGIKLLAQVRKDYPQVMRIMVTGQEDFSILTGAIHKAHVFSLHTKSCPPDELLASVLDAAKKSRNVRSDADSMRDTMFGTVRMLVDILELTTPSAMRRSKRIRRRAQEICKDMQAMPPQFMDMVVLLSSIGCVGLPLGLLKKIEKGKDVTKEDMKRFRTHPSIAAHLLERVPRMSKVADIIRHQNTPVCKNPPVGARILKVCIDLDQMQRSGAGPEKALEFMRGKPEIYDERVLDALEYHFGACKMQDCNSIMLADLEPGMVMQADMVTESGSILLHRGETLSEASHLRVRAFSDLLKVKEPLCAALPSAG